MIFLEFLVGLAILGGVLSAVCLLAHLIKNLWNYTVQDNPNRDFATFEGTLLGLICFGVLGPFAAAVLIALGRWALTVT